MSFTTSADDRISCLPRSTSMKDIGQLSSEFEKALE